MSDNDYSSDEEVVELIIDRDRPKNQNFFEETVPLYDDSEFREHFRLSRRIVERISDQYSQSVYFSYQAGGNGKLSSSQQTHIFLWYVGHQTASFRDVADRFNISIGMLHTIIKRYSYFLSNLSSQLITWPSNEEKLEILQHFEENGFPGVIGVIDGTHIKIDKPAVDPDSYLNRKHFFSIQVCKYVLQHLALTLLVYYFLKQRCRQISNILLNSFTFLF